MECMFILTGNRKEESTELSYISGYPGLHFFHSGHYQRHTGHSFQLQEDKARR